MKRISRLLGLLMGAVVLVLFLLLGLQATSNQQAKEIQIKKSWNAEILDKYLETDFGVSLPLGMTFWSNKLGYQIQSTHFVVPAQTSVYELFRLLRKNRNQTVNIVIPPGIYTKEMSRILDTHFDIESETLNSIWKQDGFWEKFGFDAYNWPALVVPNTYNYSRNTSLEDFFERLQQEHILFWNAERRAKLQAQKITLSEAVTLASIVQKESLKTDEYELIAGVYLNRLRINMYLGADPTLVFIRGKGGRVYNKDMNIRSPYNTYRNKGLPPGPICIPSVPAINAVLNYTEHPYLYFCAKSDLSGYHVFERHYDQHLKNARLFQKKLNQIANRKAGRL